MLLNTSKRIINKKITIIKEQTNEIIVSINTSSSVETTTSLMSENRKKTNFKTQGDIQVYNKGMGDHQIIIFIR